MPRKKKVGTVRQSGLLPSPDEINVPPNNLLEYTTCLYGTKGIGKTTLASSFPGYVVIMTEPLRKNLKIRQAALPCNDYENIVDNGAQDSWPVFKQMIEEAVSDDTVQGLAIDTVDRLYEACLAHHCVEENVRHPGEMNDFGALWSIIKNDFEQTLNSIRENNLGLLLISHAKEDDIELNTGAKAKAYAPSASGAATRYIKAACDYAFFFGYHGRDRCIHLRGFERIWTACGVQDRFISKSGEPLKMIHITDNHVGNGYELLEAGFNNEIYDYDEEPEEPAPTRKRRTKRS